MCIVREVMKRGGKKKYVFHYVIISFLILTSNQKQQVWSLLICLCSVILLISTTLHNTGCQKGLGAQSTLFMDKPALQVAILPTAACK